MASHEAKVGGEVEHGSRPASPSTSIPIDVGSDGSVPAINNKSIINGASEQVGFEHSLTIRQAIKYYKWAIFWCLAVRYAPIQPHLDFRTIAVAADGQRHSKPAPALLRVSNASVSGTDHGRWQHVG